MKILLDSCVWGGSKKTLQSAGYDVVWCGDWQKDPGDEEILTFAYKDKRILVTLDKDFGTLAVARGFPHCGIIRLVGISAKEQALVCGNILSRYGVELSAGAIVTVGRNRIRIRSAF